MPPKAPSDYNSNAAARRVAEKARRDEYQKLLSKLDPEYVTKLRHDCLRAANARLGVGSDPRAVVREAEQALEAQVRFLLTKGDAS